MRYFCRVVLLLVVSLTLSCHGRNAYDHAPTEAFLRSIKQKLYPGMRTTGHYCTWEGVSCPGNQEVHVKLTDGVLEGDLNSLFPFPQGTAFVIEVDFSNNRNLYGSYPPEFGTDLKNLWYLSLRNTRAVRSDP
ncbi:hypothetical protein ADEAN_000798300 [Angomonas deanei]|uniref:Uncharacterized protein n=1 Tax=Angomonas deanei TaxID=59799 RepID=A0A7G2CNF6_9TRYP|nr:hypothetical protein ADEAN_000798300 [Angomonas deanei]